MFHYYLCIKINLRFLFKKIIFQESAKVPVSEELSDFSSLARSALAETISFPAPPSGQRVRLRGGGAPYSGYLELFHADVW